MGHPARPEQPGARLTYRILLGVALYGLLLTLWLSAGLDRAYDDLVLHAGMAVVPLLTHFPIGSSEVAPVTLHNQAYVLVLLVSLFVVADRMSWGERCRRYGVFLVLIVLSHVAGLALQLHLGLALKFEGKMQVPLLLPWERQLLTAAFQLLFLFGLQIAAFLLLLLTVLWSSRSALGSRFGAAPVRGRPRPLRLHLAWPTLAVAAILLVSALVLSLWWLRERAPAHVEAHVYIGHTFLAQGQAEQAETQYRAAVRGGTHDGRTWFNLIALVGQRGGADEARRLRLRALATVEDPTWRARIAG